MVEVLDIQQKRKSYPIAIASLDDFSCIPDVVGKVFIYATRAPKTGAHHA